MWSKEETGAKGVIYLGTQSWRLWLIISQCSGERHALTDKHALIIISYTFIITNNTLKFLSRGDVMSITTQHTLNCQYIVGYYKYNNYRVYAFHF